MGKEEEEKIEEGGDKKSETKLLDKQSQRETERRETVKGQREENKCLS